jgi:excisionase family DNA binding protein
METMESSAFSLRTASQYLGVSQAALRTWKRQGHGPAYFRAGKLLRYRKSDLDAWIEARRVCPEQTSPKQQ